MSAYTDLLYQLSAVDEARRYEAAVMTLTFIGGVQQALTASGQAPWVLGDGDFARHAKAFEDYLKGDGTSKA